MRWIRLTLDLGDKDITVRYHIKPETDEYDEMVELIGDDKKSLGHFYRDPQAKSEDDAIKNDIRIYMTGYLRGTQDYFS